MKIEIVPYISVDGIRTFTNTYIRSLYERMVHEGTADIVFSDGEINSAESFLNAMKYGQNYLLVVFDDGKEAAIIWLNRFKSKTAYAHFCGFSDFWGKDSVKIGRITMDHILSMKDSSGSAMFETILGLIPVANKVAVKWLKKVGLSVIGEIPNALWNKFKNSSENGLLMCITERENENL